LDEPGIAVDSLTKVKIKVEGYINSFEFGEEKPVPLLPHQQGNLIIVLIFF
jgi:hypothetical protein